MNTISFRPARNSVLSLLALGTGIALGLVAFGTSSFAANPSCGAVVTGAISLSADMDCTGSGGPALIFSGDSASLDGRGFRVKSSDASYLLLAQSGKFSMRKVILQGSSSAIGALVINSTRVEFEENTMDGLLIGVQVYTSSGTTKAEFEENRIRNSTLFAIRMISDGSGQIRNPEFEDNDFSGSGSYALHLTIDAANLELRGNRFRDSNGAVYLAKGDFKISDLRLGRENIVRTAITVSDANSLKMDNVDVSSPHGFTVDQTRGGVSLYRVKSTKLSNISASGMDFGIKLATDSGVVSDFQLSGSDATSEQFSGLIIQAYDSTPFGKVKVQGNDFRGNPAGFGIYQAPGTTLGAGSSISGNRF